MTRKPARKLELTTTVAAPLEAVWEAITTAEGMSAWYVSSADVEPGVGGKVSISFG